MGAFSTQATEYGPETGNGPATLPPMSPYLLGGRPRNPSSRFNEFDLFGIPAGAPGSPTYQPPTAANAIPPMGGNVVNDLQSALALQYIMGMLGHQLQQNQFYANEAGLYRDPVTGEVKGTIGAATNALGVFGNARRNQQAYESAQLQARNANNNAAMRAQELARVQGLQQSANVTGTDDALRAAQARYNYVASINPEAAPAVLGVTHDDAMRKAIYDLRTAQLNREGIQTDLARAGASGAAVTNQSINQAVTGAQGPRRSDYGLFPGDLYGGVSPEIEKVLADYIGAYSPHAAHFAEGGVGMGGYRAGSPEDILHNIRSRRGRQN